MINAINTGFQVTKANLGYFTTGIIASPLITKVIDVFAKCLKDIYNYIMDSKYMIRIRSLGCEECSCTHRDHINKSLKKEVKVEKVE